MAARVKLDIGTKYNDLEFLGETDKVKDGRRLGKFHCYLCGKDCELAICRIAKGTVKSCGCASPVYKYNSNKGSYGDDYQAYILWKRVEYRAKKTAIEFELTIADIREQYEKQNGRCYYSDQPFELANNFTEVYEHTRPSVDRIDSSKGYVKDNIQLTTKDINFMKQSLSDEEFIRLCCLVADTHKKKLAEFT